MTCSCTAARSTAPTAARRRCATAYERGETDEFIEPTLVGAEARISPGDSVLVLQLQPRPHARAHPRAGRARLRRGRGEQLPGWTGAAAIGARRARYTTLTEYEEGWPYPVAFPPERPLTTLGTVLAAAGARQLHVAETEKYAARDVLLQRRRGGAASGRAARAGRLAARRADLRPQAGDERARGGDRRCSCDGLARATRPRVRRIINFANADMVGHTGVIAAAVSGVETVDECLGEVVRGGARERWRVRGDRRPRQRRPHARARRQPEHGAFAEPGAADRDGAGADAEDRRTGSWRMSRRRCWSCWGCRSRAEMTGRSLIEG